MKKLLIYLMLMLPVMVWGQAVVQQSKTPASGATAGNSFFQWYSGLFGGYLIVPNGNTAVINRQTGIEGQIFVQWADTTLRAWHGGQFVPISGGGGSSGAIYFTNAFSGSGTSTSPIDLNYDTLKNGRMYFGGIDSATHALRYDTTLYGQLWKLNSILPNGVISGLGMSIVGSNVLTASGMWRISGNTYTTSGTTTLPIDAQDPTLSRYDVVYGNTSNTLAIVSGTLSATPVYPSIPGGTTLIGAILITPTSVTVIPQPIANYVTNNTDQTIMGDKTFSGVTSMTSPDTRTTLVLNQSTNPYLALRVNGGAYFNGQSEFTQFVQYDADAAYAQNIEFGSTLTNNHGLQWNINNTSTNFYNLKFSATDSLLHYYNTYGTNFATHNNAIATLGDIAASGITLTTTGSSGAATLIGGVLNIPVYSGASYSAGNGLSLSGTTFKADTAVLQTVLNFFPKGDTRYLQSSTAGTTYVPLTRTLTGGIGVNTIGDLSANRTISLDTTSTVVTKTFGGRYVTTNSAASLASLNVTGTGGAGFFDMVAQSSPPSTPAVNHQHIYADASGRFTIMGSNGFGLSISKSLLTATRVILAPDSAGTIALESRVIPNASLANSAITINGTPVSLGASTTVTASTTAALTMNNGGAGDASGTTFNGGTARTLSYNTLGAAPLASPTFTGTVTIPTPFTLGATSVTSTGTQLNYLNAATGTTGTTSTNLVYSTSPTLVTPALGVATATSINGNIWTTGTGTLTQAAGSTLTTTGAFNLSLIATATTTATFPTGTGTLAYMGGANNWTNANSFNRNAIAAVTTQALVAGNSTAATVGTVSQWSPYMGYTGAGWNTTSAASNTVNFNTELRPVSAAAVTGDLVTKSQVNAGGFTDIFTLNSSGAVNHTGTIVATANNQIATGITGSYTFTDGAFTGVVHSAMKLTFGAALGSQFNITDATGTGDVDLHFGNANPSSSNFAFRGNTTNTYLNAPGASGTVFFRVANTTLMSLPNTGILNLVTAPATASGTPDILVRSTSTGDVQKIPFTSIAAFAVATATDANATISASMVFETLPVITANRTVSIPSASTYSGQMIVINNLNTSGTFSWSFTGATVKDASGNTLTNLANGTVYELLSNGTNFIKIN